MRRLILLSTLALGACATTAPAPKVRHQAADSLHHALRADLLTADLGLAGLSDPTPPEVSDDADGRRRLAFHSNWRGIADLSASGGFGTLYGGAAPVPGIEIKTWLGEQGMLHPHGVLLQIPDNFDPRRPCLIVAPVSGSRGIYGALASAGAFGLQRGCAVVYTDKGAGTGFFDLDAGIGISIDGAPIPASPESGFNAEVDARRMGAVRGIAFKHAHSRDNPEANWGRMTLSAARFALMALEERYPGHRFDAGSVRVIAASLSNGAGAVLQALEQDEEGLIDAALAVAPQISVAGTPSLLDYASAAALLAPCAQLAPELADAPFAPFLALRRGEFLARCALLREHGWIDGNDTDAQAGSALTRLQALGFPTGALANNPGNVLADIWRAVAVAYTQAYARLGADESPCGYGYAYVDSAGLPRPATAEERARWFGTSSGIAPSAGVQLLSPPGPKDDPAFGGLWCLRTVLDGDSETSARLQRGQHAIRARGQVPLRPLVIVHGREDGLIPVGATARPYVESALRHGATTLSYWEIEHAQHFDAGLAQPAFAARFVPLLPYFHLGMEQLLAHLDGGPAPAPSQVVRTQRRGLNADGSAIALGAEHLGQLRAKPGADAIGLQGDRLRVPE